MTDSEQKRQVIEAARKAIRESLDHLRRPESLEAVRAGASSGWPILYAVDGRKVDK